MDVFFRHAAAEVAQYDSRIRVIVNSRRLQVREEDVGGLDVEVGDAVPVLDLGILLVQRVPETEMQHHQSGRHLCKDMPDEWFFKWLSIGAEIVNAVVKRAEVAILEDEAAVSLAFRNYLFVEVVDVMMPTNPPNLEQSVFLCIIAISLRLGGYTEALLDPEHSVVGPQESNSVAHSGASLVRFDDHFDDFVFAQLRSEGVRLFFCLRSWY